MHGGDIYRNEVDLDFSVNINSFGMPESVEKALKDAIGKCTCYPDIKAEKLKEAIAEMIHVDVDHIICGNGASELFLALIRAVDPKKVLIPVPSFYGYEKVTESSSCEVVYYEMKEEDEFCLTDDFLPYLTDDTDLVFFTNPNNPVGNCIRRPLLEKIIKVCYEKGIRVVLDECFIEFTDKRCSDTFIHKTVKYPNVTVVRAFTKIFAIPGVRLGYLICSDKNLKEKIYKQLPEWNLSVFAQEAGCAAAKEVKFIEDTAKQTAKERRYLEKELWKLSIRVYEGEADFLLLYTEIELKEELLKRKILIRDCSSFRGLKEGFFRVSVKQRKENEQLISAIKEIQNRKGQV